MKGKMTIGIDLFCKDCGWFCSIRGYQRGLCRHDAPTHDKEITEDVLGQGLARKFPIVSEFDWCGEFSFKEKTNEKNN